ncbi:hypothetical protein SCLCIDRAFT_1221749 [Scleroderma citrinum Foug A]|uniref:Uncharacterized protein n=1 Tax=Scleroderma citrinum Foug A TaxID=1036808 RepID=A0A0C2YYQ2_9AGAM|nr:hypothetical protein SCLCIDRAFT_1221749 [Scleroderma citrinum Foug A]
MPPADKTHYLKHFLCQAAIFLRYQCSSLVDWKVWLSTMMLLLVRCLHQVQNVHDDDAALQLYYANCVLGAFSVRKHLHRQTLGSCETIPPSTVVSH